MKGKILLFLFLFITIGINAQVKVGDSPVQLTLAWDFFSDIPRLADELSSLRVVGFSSALQQWLNLGNINIIGDFASGEIIS